MNEPSRVNVLEDSRALEDDFDTATAETSCDELLATTSDIVCQQLSALTRRIDEQGFYPREVMQCFGDAGVFRQHLAASGDNTAMDLRAAIDAMAVISAECMSTGFMVWCQDVLGWYIENSDNDYLKTQLLPKVAAGKALGGTALSNPMKFFSGIEPLKISAEKVDGGYRLNGRLPWVSNLGKDHYFAAVCQVENPVKREVMLLVPCASENFELREVPEFLAMDGTATYQCRFNDVFISDDYLLADPIGPYLKKIRPGFVMLQAGMALGVINSCIDLMKKVNKQFSHINCYLDDGPELLEARASDLYQQVCTLTADPFNQTDDFFRSVLEARLAASELSLQAAQSCLLHYGAKGFLKSSAPQRKLRESYFVAIVTPAIKHLRKEIATLSAA